MNQILWWEVADLSNLEIFIKNHPKNAPKRAKHVAEKSKMKISLYWGGAPRWEVKPGQWSVVKTLPGSYRVAVISMHEMYIVRLLLVCMDTSLIMTKRRPDTAIINYYKT